MSVDLLKDESLVEEAPVRHQAGRVLAAEGTLYLTNKRLVFVPKGRLDRTLGAKPLRLSLRSIDGLTLETGGKPRLVARVGEQSHVFVDVAGRLSRVAVRAQALIGEIREARPRGTSEPPLAMRATIASPTADPADRPSAPTTGRVTDAQLSPVGEPVVLVGDVTFHGIRLSEITRALDLVTHVHESLDAALALLRDARPALVVLDVSQPGTDPAAHLAELATTGTGAPLWIVEPLFEKVPAELHEAHGVVGFLDRSAEPNGVSDLVNGLLRGEPTPPHRRHPRVATHFPVDVLAEDGRVADTRYARAIGTGGCFLETDQPRVLGDEVRLRFRVPDDPTIIDVRAVVVYVRPAPRPDAVAPPSGAPGMGLKFRDLAEAHLAAIRRYIEDKLHYKVNESMVTLGL